ncbi:MAG: tetratricopeptide repeat protein [Rhodospirillaceae bacterium]|nr:tetratricopeptide repeat protein [Rhodospirillaceae bacterium]
MIAAAALSALQAGDNAGAEAALKPQLALRPDDPQLLRLLATALVRQNRPEEAEPPLRRLVAVEPLPDSLSFLADVQYRLHHFAACEETLARLIAMDAATSEQIRQYAKVIGAKDDGLEARAFLRDAMERTGDVNLMAAYGDTFGSDPARAALEFEALLPRVAAKPDQTAYLLKHITLHRARANRIARGLHPDFAVSWEDMCVWADPEGITRLHQALVAEVTGGPKVRGGAYVDLACTALVQQNWGLAEALLTRVRGKIREPAADCAAFGPAFHEPIEVRSDAEILAGLAPVQHVFRLGPHAPATLFLASDYGYFKRFTLPFVKALEAAGVRADVQIHLLDGDTGQWASAAADLTFARCVHLGLSAEASGALTEGIEKARVYYHAVRFIRLFQEVQRTGRATWLVDADVNLLRSPLPLFKAFKDFDLAVRAIPTWLEPNWKFAAACVGVAPTPRGLEYVRRVAAYIAHWRANGSWTWGVDQMALYSCFARMCELGRPPAAWFLGPEAVCGPGDDTGVFQFMSGVQKYDTAARTGPL